MSVLSWIETPGVLRGLGEDQYLSSSPASQMDAGTIGILFFVLWFEINLHFIIVFVLVRCLNAMH